MGLKLTSAATIFLSLACVQNATSGTASTVNRGSFMSVMDTQ